MVSTPRMLSFWLKNVWSRCVLHSSRTSQDFISANKKRQNWFGTFGSNWFIYRETCIFQWPCIFQLFSKANLSFSINFLGGGDSSLYMAVSQGILSKKNYCFIFAGKTSFWISSSGIKLELVGFIVEVFWVYAGVTENRPWPWITREKKRKCKWGRIIFTCLFTHTMLYSGSPIDYALPHFQMLTLNTSHYLRSVQKNHEEGGEQRRGQVRLAAFYLELSLLLLLVPNALVFWWTLWFTMTMG